jgi:hypothetical protein
MGASRQFVTLVAAAVLCVGISGAQTAPVPLQTSTPHTATPQTATPRPSASQTATKRHKPKEKKAQLPPPLPSGPQGPVPQIPLDSIPAVPPQVSYQSGELTIVAPNSTLGDILRAVRKQTAAEIEIPGNANERVATHLGPGPARAVMAELLNGSKFNYVLLGSPSDVSQLTRVVLVAKTSDTTGTNPPGQSQQPGTNPAAGMAVNMTPPQQQDIGSPDANDSEAAVDESVDDNADQNAAEADQQQPQPGQDQGIKTPQQMLQEMQQRQLQMQQQQQQTGQPPLPGPGYPPGQPQPPPQQQ